MSTASSLLRGSVFRTVELIVVVGAAFFVTPALVHALGDRVYGFWSLVVAFIGYYGLLDLGLTQAAARYLSQALGKDDVEELERVAGTGFALFTAIGAAVVLLTAISWAATPLVVKDPAEAELFRRLLLVMGAAAALGFPAKVYTGLLQASLRYDLIAAISIARSVLCNGAIYAAARSGRGVMTVAWITLAVGVLQYGGTWAAFRACFPNLRVSPGAAERGRVRVMFSHGWTTVVCQLGDVMRFRLDTIVVGSFLGAALVTPYAVAVRVVEGYVQLVQGVIGMMLPVFSRYEGRGDYEAIRVTLLKATKLGTALSTFVGLSVVFYGRAFVRRWMGPGFDDAYGVAAILAGAMIIDLPESPGIQLLYGLSKHRPYAVLGLIEGVVNLALSVVLLRRYGIYGVAYGTLVEFAFFKLLVQPIYICRPIALPVRVYLVDTILWTFLKTAAPLAAFYLAVARFVTPDYGALLACGTAQTLFFIPVAYLLVLSPDERSALAAALAGRRARRKAAAAAATLEG